MRIIFENVPLMVSKVVKFQQGQPPVVGSGHILLDRNSDRRIIDFKKLERAKCNAGEVNRALQVLVYFFGTC